MFGAPLPCNAVAHIKDHGSGQWWRFDDTDAEEMGPHPNVRHTDHGVSAAAAGVGKKAEIGEHTATYQAQI